MKDGRYRNKYDDDDDVGDDGGKVVISDQFQLLILF